MSSKPPSSTIFPDMHKVVAKNWQHELEQENIDLLDEAEALATALEGALTMWHMPAKDWTDALDAYRAKHPKPSTKPAYDVK